MANSNKEGLSLLSRQQRETFAFFRSPGISQAMGIKVTTSETGALVAETPDQQALANAMQNLVDKCERHSIECVKQREAARLSKLLYSSIIYRVPNEILLYIFRYASCLLEDNIFGVGHVWESTAYALSAVCKQWREIALIMPELWASFAVDLRNGDRTRPAVKLMLERSKDIPISFYITSPPDDYGSWMGFDDDEDKESLAYKARRRRDEVQWELMDLIAEHKNRWRSFNIDTVHEAVQDSVDHTFSLSENDERATPPPFHRLEGATIDMSLCGAPTIYETVMNHAPNLSTLTLKYDFTCMDEYPEILPQMAKIRHLTLEAATIDLPWTDLMRSCSHLRSFVYRGDKDRGKLLGSYNCPVYQKPDQSEPPVECKELESISIDLACLDYHGKPTHDLLSSFFTAVKAPLLQSLTMYAEDSHFDTSIFTWPWEVITSFVSAIQPGKLTTLRVKDLPVDASDLLALLELTPFLEELTVREHRSRCPYHLTILPYRDHTDQFHQTVTKLLLNRLRVSSEDPSSPFFLPRLRFIKLFVHERHFDGDCEFVEMVRSRSSIPVDSAVTPLRQVELWIRMEAWKDDLLNGTYEPLKVLERERGMQISVVLLSFLGIATRLV